MSRTHEQVRDELRRDGASITQWALSHGFSPALTLRVLKGNTNPTRGQTYRIAVALGIKPALNTEKTAG